MIDVVVADDQDLIRAGLAALIDASPGLQVVGQAATGREAVAQAAAKSPDVVVMDIRMPGLDGIAATEHITAADGYRGERPRVLILTTFDLDEYVYAALRAGAAGFLLKETGPDRLLAAIHSVALGEGLFAPTVTRRLIEAYAHRAGPASPLAARLAALTPREVEVLRAVGHGQTNAEIAEHLQLGESTVKTHISRTMTKLGVTSRAQAVVVAYESGLITPRRQ
jgi:DNA-binding NarL/FixJ family response regulator